jgi:UPF0716 protein FxsA
MLFLLFIVLPAVELALLIRVGMVIGTLETLALIVITGVVGASLARRQGLGVLLQVQREMQQGRVPGEALADGAIILLGAALLITPGVITDAIGLLCLIPVTRRGIKVLVWKWLEHQVRSGHAQVYVFSGGPQDRQRDSDIAAEYEVLGDDKSEDKRQED